MVKVISQVRVNEKQLEILESFKEKQFALKKEIHSDLFPAIVESLRQTRELTQNIALISGAIASFTIPVVNTPFVQVKIFAYLALVFLFILICYAVYHLTEVLSGEVNGLSNQHTTYSNLIDDTIDRINSVIESGEINKLVDFDKSDVLSRLNELKTDQKPDKSLDILRILLVVSLSLLSMSFVPLHYYLCLLTFFNYLSAIIF